MRRASRGVRFLSMCFVVGLFTAATVRAGYCRADSHCQRTPCGTSSCQCCKPAGQDWECREDAPCTGFVPVEEPPIGPVTGN